MSIVISIDFASRASWWQELQVTSKSVEIAVLYYPPVEKAWKSSNKCEIHCKQNSSPCLEVMPVSSHFFVQERMKERCMQH